MSRSHWTATLQDAGYAAFDESRVMAAELQPVSTARPTRPMRDVGASEFAGIVGALRGSDAATIAAERQRIVSIALPSHFLVLDDGEQPVACGCVVIDGACGGIFNMVTAERLRGRGHGSAIVGELLRRAAGAGARHGICRWMRRTWLRVTSIQSSVSATAMRTGTAPGRAIKGWRNDQAT